MTRKLFWLFTAIFLALPPGAASQQPSKTARIGYISSVGTAPESQIRAFREGLNDLGYFEGKNISIEFRHPKQRSEDVPSLIAGLLQRKVDVLIALDPTAIRAAKQATQTVPIVMLTNQDPVAIGLVDSLARPGGNITGITRINRQLSGKRLEILTEIRPGSSCFGLLWVPPSALGTLTAFKSYTAAATALKLQIVSLQVNRSNPDLDGAFQAAAKERVGGVITVTNAAFRPHQAQIAALGIKHRMPTLCEVSDYVESGCLSSYATDDAESFRRAATYVDKILKGTKPADLPIEQPTKFAAGDQPENRQANRSHDSAERAGASGSGDQVTAHQKFLWLSTALLLAFAGVAETQQPPKIPKIGWLSSSPLSATPERIEAFRRGLRELGYVEGKNIVIEWRSGEGKPGREKALAAELVRLRIDVLVTGGSTATRPAKEATASIPIVMAQDSDPVGNGFVVSLARPGGNITGLSNFAPELSGKRLELLKEIVSRLSRVAILGTSTVPGNAQLLRETELAAETFGVKLQYIDILAPKDIEAAFRAAGEGRADAILMLVRGPVVTPHRKQIAKLAAKKQLPAIYSGVEYVEDGGLISYGVSLPDLDRRAASYVDKILKGAKAADLPVEQPKKFELIVNIKAAKQIGLTILPNVLARADRVIR